MLSIPLEIQKSVLIERSLDDVFTAVTDFATWPKWSPWLCQEPDCPVAIEGPAGKEGHRQSWNGDFIGSGNMFISRIDPGQTVEYDLLFLKPWKSKSRTGFRFAAKAGGTEVTWWMQGSLPFFLFFMKKMMKAFVASDYTRGLAMLKEHLEVGSVPSKTRVLGLVERKALHYVGIRRSCSLSEVGPAMEKDLLVLGQRLEDGTLSKPKHVFSLYHEHDMVGGRCEYTAGGLFESRQDAPEGFVAGQLPDHKALRVDHDGAYRHLGNAWSAAMGCARAKHKLNKAVSVYEIYATDPREVLPNEQKVEIYVPVKG